MGAWLFIYAGIILIRVSNHLTLNINENLLYSPVRNYWHFTDVISVVDAITANNCYLARTKILYIDSRLRIICRINAIPHED